MILIGRGLDLRKSNPVRTLLSLTERSNFPVRFSRCAKRSAEGGSREAEAEKHGSVSGAEEAEVKQREAKKLERE